MSQSLRWSSRSLGSRLQHEFFYACIRLGGWRLAYALLGFVVLFYTLRPSIRARSRPYLSRRFPDAGRTAMFLHAFRHNLEFGKILVDRAVLGITGQGSVEAQPGDTRSFKELLNKGRGLMVVTAHAGAWQWAMSGLSFTGRQMHVLYRRETGDVDRQYFEHFGHNEKPIFIDPCSDFGGVIEVMAALRSGGVVCAMGDRMLGAKDHSVTASLLGAPITLPVGPFYIAAKLGTPVALVFAPRVAACQAHIVVARVFENTLDADPAAMAKAFAKDIEMFVHNHPYQFFNYYDLWA